jgi:hypothetical protein
METTAIVDTNTNEFIEAGHIENARYVRRDLPRNPDPRVERWSGDPAQPFAPKTSQEMSDAATAQADAAAASGIDQQDLRAAMLALWEAIPGPLMTKAQLRARAIAIRKSL